MLQTIGLLYFTITADEKHILGTNLVTLNLPQTVDADGQFSLMWDLVRGNHLFLILIIFGVAYTFI